MNKQHTPREMILNNNDEIRDEIKQEKKNESIVEWKKWTLEHGVMNEEEKTIKKEVVN